MLWLTLARYGRKTEKALACYDRKSKKALARLYETPARCGFVYPLPEHPIPFHSGRVFGIIRTHLGSGPGVFGGMKWL